MKILSWSLVLAVSFIAFFPKAILAEEITIDQLLANVENAVSGIDDISYRMAMSDPLSKDSTIFYWYKRPYLQKQYSILKGHKGFLGFILHDHDTERITILKKEGDQVVCFYRIDGEKEIKKKIWGAAESFGNLDSYGKYFIKYIKNIKKEYPYTITKQENPEGIIYKLVSQTGPIGNEPGSYETELDFRVSDWLPIKEIIKCDGHIVFIHDYQDIVVNHGISDDVFQIDVPEAKK